MIKNTYACPTCGSSADIKLYGTYERNIIDYADGLPSYNRIRIQRIFCRYCGHTASILPDSLPWHGQYSHAFIRHVLNEYASGSCPVLELCDRFQITPVILYRWKRKYESAGNIKR